jgi:hypothetical protein
MMLQNELMAMQCFGRHQLDGIVTLQRWDAHRFRENEAPWDSPTAADPSAAGSGVSAACIGSTCR